MASVSPRSWGSKGNPREWLFVQLDNKWYVRNAGWKLNESGALFDLSDAPFVERLVASEGQSDAAKAARHRLQAVLDELNPAAGRIQQVEMAVEIKRSGKPGERRSAINEIRRNHWRWHHGFDRRVLSETQRHSGHRL